MLRRKGEAEKRGGAGGGGEREHRVHVLRRLDAALGVGEHADERRADEAARLADLTTPFNGKIFAEL